MHISAPAILKWFVAFIVGQWLLLPDASRGVFICLVFLMVLDWISGVGAGAVQRKLSSEVGANGLIRKGLILLMLLGVMILERIAVLIGAGALGNLHMEIVGAVGFSANEVISIMENCGKAGVWIPPQLRKMLLAIQKLKADGSATEISKLRGKVRKAQTDLDASLDVAAHSESDKVQ